MKCIYCGAIGDSTEHVPPRCFLERPYPANISTVRSCLACNQRFSKDEEYAIALLAQIGETDWLTAKITKDGCVDRAFRRKPAFEQRFIDRLGVDDDGRVFIEPENERLGTVFTKVICGLYYLRYKKPVRLDNLGPIAIWPFDTDGCAVLHECFSTRYWIIIQTGIFEYLFTQIDGKLYCIVNWHNTLGVICMVPRPRRGKGKSHLKLLGQCKLPLESVGRE